MILGRSKINMIDKQMMVMILGRSKINMIDKQMMVMILGRSKINMIDKQGAMRVTPRAAFSSRCAYSHISKCIQLLKICSSGINELTKIRRSVSWIHL